MVYDREGRGNEQGIKEVAKALDPLKQKNIMLKKSMLKSLKLKAFVDEKSESQIIAEALAKVL